MTTGTINRTYQLGFLAFLGVFIISNFAQAIPAFARREGVQCTMCHANGNPPHLNEVGYMYRRMAFHLPSKLGDVASDDTTMKATNHMSAGVNVGYLYNESTTGGVKTVNSSNINMPEVELWPLAGGFLGNWGAWSEFDATPTTNTDSGGVEISQADLRYASGTADSFYNIRAGLVAPEGIGASDQWLDDANIPLMETLAPNNNGYQDTLATPFGAMGQPQLGFEFGLNYSHTHLTFGIYDGFTAADLTGATAAALQVATLKSMDPGMNDYRFQWDQFIGESGVLTAAYYQGTIPLNVVGQTFGWLDHYNQQRLYYTYYAIPSTVDVMVGISNASNEYNTGATATPTGTFQSTGGFLGAYYYVNPKLTLIARADQFNYSSLSTADKTSGLSLQAAIPMGNPLLIMHINTTSTTLAGTSTDTTDVGALLRFLL